MCGQTQHDQICVSSVETVVSVGVMVGLTSLTTNEVHDLVLILTWDIGIRQDYLEKNNSTHSITHNAHFN